MSHGNKDVVLVTGAAGQLGTAVANYLRDEGHCRVLAFARNDFDIGEDGILDTIDDPQAPNVIINCAAYTKVALADQDPREAWRVNSRAVARLAEWCMLKDATLIHISTDFVFGQENPGTPYNEDSRVGPVNQYGCSKLGGEYEILRVNRARPFKHFVIRTAGVFDMPRVGKPRNFPDGVTKYGLRAEEPISVIDDVHTNLTRAEDLAKAIAWFLSRKFTLKSGIWNVTNPGECTWYEVAKRLGNRLNYAVQRTSKIKYWEAQKRDPSLVPNYTCLDLRNYQIAGGPDLPTIGQALDEWCDAFKILPGREEPK